MLNVNVLEFKKYLNINAYLLIAAFLIGALIIKVPVWLLLVLVILVTLTVYFFIKQDHCFYFALVTLTIQKRIDIPVDAFLNIDYLTIYLYDLMIFQCIFIMIYNLLFKRQTVNLLTKLDKWFFLLAIIFIISGLMSASKYGIIYCMKYLEILAFYYIVIYFLRSKIVNLLDCSKVLIYTAILQAIFAILQSFIGDGSILPMWMSSHFYDGRGFWGYLGVGSNYVWHGRGLFPHFIFFGMYMGIIIIFYLPIKKYIFKNEKVRNLVLVLFVWALIVSYSRSALLFFTIGTLYYKWFISKNKIIYLINLLSVSILAFLATFYLLYYTEYINTISFRGPIWEYTLAELTSSYKYLFFGSGLDVYYDYVYWRIYPVKSWLNHPHSSFLELILYIGLTGLAIYIVPFVKTLISSFKNYLYANNFNKDFYLAVHMIMILAFISGIHDRSFSKPSFFLLYILLMGLFYANKRQIIK